MAPPSGRLCDGTSIPVVATLWASKSPLRLQKNLEKSLRFVEDGANYLKLVPRDFQDPGKHKVAILWVVPNAKKAPLAGGKPDSLQGVLELEHFESACGVPV